MPHFRKDPFGPTWVIISPERGLEPSDFGAAVSTPGPCSLCPGNEHETGPEIRALRPTSSSTNDGLWNARVLRLDGLFETDRAFAPEGEPLFMHAPAGGRAELVVEHREHGARLETMPVDHLVEILRLYRDRLERLASQPDVRHVQLTRNVGRAAGAAFDHPHAQILALPVPNRWVGEEHAAAGEHHAQTGRCLFCDVIEAELTARERLVTYNDAYVAIAPYAAKTPFETWILPRQHDCCFATTPANTLPELAEILRSTLAAMTSALDSPPYNMILHTLPRSRDDRYHWNLKLLPRLTSQAGFDWTSGFYVNPTPPEDAVRFLREAMLMREAVA